MRNLAIVLLASVLLAGCSLFSVQVDRYGATTYRLESAYGSAPETLVRARAQIRAKADSLCPMGWYRSNDYDRLSGTTRYMVWVISCDVQHPTNFNMPR